MNPSSNPAAPAQLSGAKFVIGTFAVALATFMNVLDSSIANVAIPTLSGNLGVSIDEGTWVITLFAAANAVSIPLTGWLTQRIGQVKLFVWAILLFVLSSAACGLAPNLLVLLAARVVQGAVAGPLVPLSQALLLASFPKEKSSNALALWAMTATVGPIAGPALKRSWLPGKNASEAAPFGRLVMSVRERRSQILMLRRRISIGTVTKSIAGRYAANGDRRGHPVI